MRRLLIAFGSTQFQDAADNRSFTASRQFACRADAAFGGGGGAGAPGFALAGGGARPLEKGSFVCWAGLPLRGLTGLTSIASRNVRQRRGRLRTIVLHS